MEPNEAKTNSNQQNNNPHSKKSHIRKYSPNIDNEKQPYTIYNARYYDKNNSPSEFCKKWKKDSPANKIIAIFTILLGLTAIPLVIIGIFQAKYSRDSIKEAQRSIVYTRFNDSLNTIEQKRLADNSIAVSRDIAKIQEQFAKINTRAYLNLESLKITIRANDSIRVNYRVINSGKTPARHVVMSTTIINPYIIEEQNNLINNYANILKGIIQRRDTVGYVLGSSIRLERNHVGNKIISLEDYVSISKRLKYITFIGLVKYVDIFNDKHYTWFCLNLLTDGTYTTYSKYNDAD